MNPIDIIKWRTLGVHLQNAFPYLSASERELIKSGTCGKCWDKMFPEEDEDERLVRMPKHVVVMRFNMN